jgi:LysR family transcriptional regulator for metE and metH
MGRLESEAIDLAITGRPSGAFSSASAKISDHPYIVVVPPEHRLENRKEVAMPDLLDETFLVREEGSGSRALMETVFSRYGFIPARIGLEADSNETIKQGVMAGLGIAFISAHTVSQELQTGQLVSLPLAEFPVVRAWYIVQNPQRDASPATIALRDYIERESATFIPQFSQAA